MNRLCSFAILAVAALFAGCASSNHSDSPTTTTSPAEPTAITPITASAQQPSHAECLVCKMNVDLACVDVDVDKKTPRTVYNGKTYYFCSDECKAKFEKNPAKYAKADK